MRRQSVFLVSLASVALAVAAFAEDLPEVRLGERLFLETRFAEFFYSHSHGNANAVLAQGDPVMDTTQTSGQPFPGPFAGQSMNCRACHLVDEHDNTPGGGMRPLCDFAPASPIPLRNDGRLRTTRNSPMLADALGGGRKGVLLHADGEFATPDDLIVATLTGRNFGWLPTEDRLALAHIAKIIREDNGTGALAQQFGGLPYRVVFEGTASDIPESLRLPRRFRVEVGHCSDKAIVRAVAKLLRAYLEAQTFGRDASGTFTGSPYDAFLRKNQLPAKPNRGETDLAYARRLRQLVEQLDAPQFVTDADGSFQTHDQLFVFGPEELNGLKVFLREPPQLPLTPEQIEAGNIGNCAICHTPPYFTDFEFHNIGVSQDEYETVHGTGAFDALSIPDLATRNASPDAWLPPTPKHPFALGPFRSAASTNAPGQVDLGLWNVFANPDFPRPQRALRKMLDGNGNASTAELLPLTIGRFKTPALRDLDQSWPYFHNGSQDSLSAVLYFYIGFSDRARNGELRNIDPQMFGVSFTKTRLEVLQFLRSLNQDYP